MHVSFVEIYCEKIRDLLKKDGKKGIACGLILALFC
jgi:hypothetical protein